MGKFVRFVRALRIALFGVPAKKPQPAPPCSHQWEHYGTTTGEYVIGGGCARHFTLRCAKCGDMKQHVVN
jgi:hypothetical protein